MNNFLPEYKDKLQILTNELNLSLKMIKYSFLKVHEKMFFTHKNRLKFYGLNAIWVKRTVFGNYGLKIWVKCNMG